MKREDTSWLEGWPCDIAYNAKETHFHNAKRFLGLRPNRIIASDGVLYTLEDGIWRQLDKDEFAAEVQTTNGQLILDVPEVRGLIEAVHMLRFSKARPFEWIEMPNGAANAVDMIPFGNGLLDFKTGKLWPYDGRYFATGCPDYDFDPGAKCPLWETKLAEWLDLSQAETLQEFFGYAMTPDTSLHKILALIGAPRGGKSTVLSVLEGLCGDSHIANLIIDDLAGPFGLEGTQDKRLIIIPDAAEAATGKRSVALNRLKAISGGDVVSVNRKHIKQIRAKIPARIVLVANKHPKLLDDSGALAKRELVITFTRSWLGDTKLDPHLGTKLQAELPGIANWALAGLKRLRANRGVFTVGEKGKAAALELEHAQSPALRFAHDCLTVTGGKEFVETDSLYKRYYDWAVEEEHLGSREIQNRTDFKSGLVAALASSSVRHGQERMPNSKERRFGWWGLIVNDKWDDVYKCWEKADT